MVRESMQRNCCGPYRIVFMDINMPVMDGYEATLEIRRLLSKKQTLVVAATAYPEKVVERRGRTVGMDEFITKPLDPKLVGSIITKVGIKRNTT